MSQVAVFGSPTVVRPRHRERKRFFLVGLMVVALCLVCLGIPILYFVLSSDRQLRTATAEADRLDPGWRTLEMEAKPLALCDEENAARVLLEAKSHMPRNRPIWEYPQAVAPYEPPKPTARGASMGICIFL